MRRSRFALSSQSSVTRAAPQNSPKKKASPKKLPKPEPIEKSDITGPIPTPVLERSINTQEESFQNIEEEEEELNEYEEELDDLAGLTRRELLELYRTKYNNYLNNIDKVSEIIESKLSAV